MTTTIPNTMKAVRFHKTGASSSVLKLENNIPTPTPKPTEVLIKLHYAGVNFIDTYQRSGLYPISLPAVSGREGAGTVIQIGSDSTHHGFKVGDRVAAFCQGTMAEYVAAPATAVVKLPQSISTKTGAAVLLQGLTAWTLVKDAHAVERGQVVLVQAAAGGTGGLLVQMAKYLGAVVIGTVSTSEKAAIAKGLGADHVIIYKEQDVLAEVMRLTGGKGVHAVFSGIGQATFTADLAATRRKGTLVSYGNSSGPVTGLSVLELSKKNVKLVRPTLANYIAEPEEFEERTGQLLSLVADGIVTVPLGGEYGLDGVGAAQDDLTAQRTTGKLVVKIA